MAGGDVLLQNARPELLQAALDVLTRSGVTVTPTNQGIRIVRNGAGTERIEVVGVSKLHGAHHSVLPDRIETGTYAMAVAMAGGDILLQNARPELLQAALDVVEATAIA